MSAVAEFTVSQKRTALTVVGQERLLPTVSGMAPGVVHTEDGGRGLTVQCSVCLRTATGPTPGDVIVIGGWHFENDTEPGRRWPLPGHATYRRCPDCRAARQHPRT